MKTHLHRASVLSVGYSSPHHVLHPIYQGYFIFIFKLEPCRPVMLYTAQATDLSIHPTAALDLQESSKIIVYILLFSYRCVF